MPSPGIVLFAHGSSLASANDAVRAVAAAVARAGGFGEVETAFLEIAHPNLDEAVAALVARGRRRIVVVPYFLTLGVHMLQDLPGIVARLSDVHQGVEIRIAQPLHGHPALPPLLVDRAREALSGWEEPCKPNW